MEYVRLDAGPVAARHCEEPVTERPIFSKPYVPGQLRALFRSLTQAALASGCMTGCAGDPAPPETDVWPDAGAGLDAASPAVPSLDAADPDSNDAEGRDAASPLDASAPADASAWPIEGWHPITCLNGSPAPLSGSRPRGGRVVHMHRLYRVSPTMPVQSEGGLSTGPACASGADGAACDSQLEQLMVQSACGMGKGCATVAILRTGDELTRLDTKAELLALLGDIDSLAEALLVAQMEGYASCVQSRATRHGCAAQTRAVRMGLRASLRVGAVRCRHLP